ncbi:phage tail family protein [Vagococcus fluvialis]|uniref:distal tail protein Dit n=1 Tax=Vagococcus fluvialis TaxID=2738 RepID=UPI001A8FAB4C|nr:distal tail protein Dit [Vagococcus fluvialis]MBO0427629.1 phage tail family protein [Vagococcus fluvialis]
MDNLYEVRFNDNLLSEYLYVTSVKRLPGPKFKARSESIRNKKYTRFLGIESDSHFIEIEYYLNGNLLSLKDSISKILNVTEPKKLILGDQKDRFYWAFPEVENSEGDKLDEKGTIRFEIFNGSAFSVNELLFTNENKNYIIVNNPGTEPMSLSLEASFSSGNGFLGIQNDDMSTKVLFGTVEEVDGYDYQKSDLLFDDHFNIDRGWKLNEGYTPPVTPERKQVGTVEYKDKPLGFVRPIDYGTGNSWHGTSLTKTVPVDKNGKYPINWRSDFRIDFNTDGGGALKYRQVGHESVSYADATGNIIASVVLEDNNVSQEKSDLVFYVEGKRVWSRINTNDYYQNMSDDRYSFIVEKIGDYITFRHSQSKTMQKFRFSNPNVELRFVTWYAATYKTHPPITNNLIRAINLRKHNVDYWQDIPNKFANGDTLKYWQEGQNLFCEVNDVNFLQFRDPGSTKILARPGQSIFYLAYSDFSTVPKVTLRGRAEYI